MVDSHTHLDHVPGEDADIVAAARRVGVNRILTIGMDPESCRKALCAAEDFEGTVFAAVGRHPNSATGFDQTAAAELQALAQHPCCRAIGETGLDFYRDRTTPEDQQRAFEAQIELARATGKPLVIHTRAAEEPTIDTLATKGDGVTVVLHCFSMPQRLDECLGHGWFVSFAGNVTYPKATDLQGAARRVPEELLLVETDSPFLSPQPVRGKPNEPANVARTAAFLAELREVGYEELEAAVERNAARVFGW
jgi:TatD DNase family protein